MNKKFLKVILAQTRNFYIGNEIINKYEQINVSILILRNQVIIFIIINIIIKQDTEYEAIHIKGNCVLYNYCNNIVVSLSRYNRFELILYYFGILLLFLSGNENKK